MDISTLDVKHLDIICEAAFIIPFVVDDPVFPRDGYSSNSVFFFFLSVSAFVVIWADCVHSDGAFAPFFKEDICINDDNLLFPGAVAFVDPRNVCMGFHFTPDALIVSSFKFLV